MSPRSAPGTEAASVDSKRPRVEALSLVETSSLECGVESLGDTQCDVIVVRRPSEHCADALKGLQDYLATKPVWPDDDEYHPQEATRDRVALIDFSGVEGDAEDPLADAIAIGRDLPRKGAVPSANAYRGIAQVVSILPAGPARDGVARDAEALLHALFKQTKAEQFQVRLERVLGDTCQKWHRDWNTLRSIVTYVGPGTLVADESSVERDSEGTVLSVAEEGLPNQGGVRQANAGDFIIMKGGRFPGSGLRGAAHRAPPIGAVGECQQYRIMLKVDIWSDVASCQHCEHDH
eukprot:TRINITY_DN52723_c0_g1_i1.p1 TRINITY_DN52723_c0_g1~~TRINITY_DN52723_c0_g1_i1.p1  ORF type:complete len:292 (-),score=25.39 TRINITY_DN52723_c0_g1_i1:62-937(-)